LIQHVLIRPKLSNESGFSVQNLNLLANSSSVLLSNGYFFGYGITRYFFKYLI